IRSGSAETTWSASPSPRFASIPASRGASRYVGRVLDPLSSRTPSEPPPTSSNRRQDALLTPQTQHAGQNGAADEPPVGGGFFNLPPPVAKPYGGQSAAPSNPVGGGGSGYPPPPTYGGPSAQDSSSMAQGGAPSGGMDMFGGMSVRAPPAANNGAARYQSQPQLPSQQHQYGGYGGPPPAAMPPQQTSGSLFSGLDVAPTAPAPMAPPAHDDVGAGGLTMPTYGGEQRKATRSSGSFNYQDVATSATADTMSSSQYSRTSATSSTGTATSRSSSKVGKKKKKKTFRPGFGRQLSDESIAALQRGDLKEDEVIQQVREGRLSSDRSDSSRSSRSVLTGPTDLAHLLPPVKSGSVLQGLTVRKGATSSGGGVLAGLTVHTSASPSPSPAKASVSAESGSPGSGVLSGLTIRRTTSSVAGDDASEKGNDVPVEEPPAPEVYKKPSPPKPAAPSTPEERLFHTLRDFHESAVSFRQLTVKQNEEENRLLERKAQLANQLTQYEMDLHDVEAQQHHACEVEDFEKADALNATINSVRHCITLTESDVRKVDSELVAFVKAKEKAFANQLKSTRGTLRELEKFREDQESERTVVRNEYKLYESNQTEQLQFEAERIDTEMHHVSVSLENVVAEKSEIEATIEGQCSSEFAVQAQLIEEKQAVEEEVRELERKLKEKLEREKKASAAQRNFKEAARISKDIKALEKDRSTAEEMIELATENEDYDTAAAYDEELESLRVEEKNIRAQLESGNARSGVAGASMFGGLDIKTTDSGSAQESEGSQVSQESEGHESPKEEVPQPSTSGSLFGGLQMSGGPAAASESSIPTTEPDVEAEEEATAPAKVEFFSPTSSDMKDSFFGTPEVPNNSDSLIAPSASGSLFGGLQLSGNFQVSTSSFSSPDDEAEEEEHDVAATEDASADAPAESGSMFNGLQLSSSAIDVTSTESVSVSTEAPVDMFGGLQLSSSASGETATPAEPASTEAMFGGLQLSSSAVISAAEEPASAPSDAPTDMFGGLQLSSSAVATTSAEPASVSAPTDMFGGLELNSSAVDAVSAETEVPSAVEESDASETNGGDSRMSIHELSEHSENDSTTEASDVLTAVSETVSTETLVETSSTTTVSMTTVTKLSDDEAETETEQDAAQP
ncbi:hypothetical protein PF002_g17985, partial [Phytophthora fragariae]